MTNSIKSVRNSCVPRAEAGAFAGPNCPLFGVAADLFIGADLI